MSLREELIEAGEPFIGYVPAENRGELITYDEGITLQATRFVDAMLDLLTKRADEWARQTRPDLWYVRPVLKEGLGVLRVQGDGQAT